MDIERLVNRHKDAVYRQMVRVCGGRHEDAEDALGEALLAAVKAADTLQSEEAFRVWLAKIGSRVCLRMRRRESLTKVWRLADENGFLDTPSKDPTPDQEVEMRRLKSCVSHAVEALPEIYRDVYVQRELEGKPAEAVAQELGLSIPALKSRLHRARSLIRAAMDSDLCSPN